MEASNKKYDFKWLLIVIILVVAAIIAVILNANNDSLNTEYSGIDIDNGDQKINWDRYETKDIELEETITIVEPGTYHLTGEISDGMIIIEAGQGKVRLILDNIKINNTSGPAIACYSADDLVIELVGDNTLEDGSSYDINYDEDVSGVIYSKGDLTFTGEGSLDLTANYQDGIVSKDDLKFSSGNYNIKASDDGIRGKDSVYIVSGNFNIETGADGIKSTNELDTKKGFILIEDGSFSLTTNSKGLKAINAIIVYDGAFSINSEDDAIHSNNYIKLADGDYNIYSNDDGVHADNELVIEDGNISITRAYEGFEAQAITINGGMINLTTSDDGINAGGGADSSANNRPGAGAFDTDEKCIISINGGEVIVNASGDGLDSNGWLYINGGTVTVDGPTNSGNGALDAGLGIVMNGGEVIAIGASGMAESLGDNSLIYNISVFLDETMPAKTKIEITDSTGETILKHVSLKSFQHIAAGSSEFKLGETYKLYIDGELEKSFTISGITTIVGESRNQQFMPPNRK